MGLWNVLSDLSVVVTLEQALEEAVKKGRLIKEKQSQDITDIIEYSQIAKDMHCEAEKLEQYLKVYHADYINGVVLAEEEKVDFFDGFFRKYPNLIHYKSWIQPVLNEYLNRLDQLLQKELRLSEKVILNRVIDNNLLLRKLIGMILDIVDEQRKEKVKVPYNANLLYADSFVQPLFLHRNKEETKVTLQNLFVIQRHLVMNEDGEFTDAECPLEEEIERFVNGKKTALFIQGDAGTGKSSLVGWMNYHQYLQDEIGEKLFGKRNVITVRLRDLERSKMGTDRMMNAILDYLKINTLDDLVDKYPQAVMILDGFDELCMIEGIADYEYLIEDVFRKNLPGFQFIITTRPKYLDIRKLCVDKICIHLAHFSKEQREKWLDKYMNICEEEISDFVKDYIRNLSEDDENNMENEDDTAVCDTPMTLYMIVAKKISKEALTNHWALYHQIFYQELSETEYNRMFPNEEWRYEHPIYRYRDILYQVSEEIAYEMYCTGNKVLQLSEEKVTKIIADILGSTISDRVVSEIAKRCYALCTYWKADTRKGIVEFYHNNIRDFFLCERIYRRINRIYIDKNVKSRYIRDLPALDEEQGKTPDTSSLGKEMYSNYYYAPFATKVCQFIYERSLYETMNQQNHISESFPLIENEMHVFPALNQEILSAIDSFSRKRSMYSSWTLQEIVNVITCAAQIFRYAAEPFLKTKDEDVEDAVLFKWWNNIQWLNEIGTLKYIFRGIFHQVPITYEDGTIIAMSRKSDFSGINLYDCDVREIDFQYSNLSNAIFANAVMDRCDLRNANCGNTDFTNISDTDMARN